MDANPVTRYAVIDQISNTLPTSVVGVNQVSRVLDAPGAWYAHVRVVDSAGNQRVVHDGPYLINRLRTPSAILPDGLLDFWNSEYTEGMFATYDPYALEKPALMLATWDANQVVSGFYGPRLEFGQAFRHLPRYASGRLNGLARPDHARRRSGTYAAV